MKKYFNFFFLLLISLSLVSCSLFNTNTNTSESETSNIEYNEDDFYKILNKYATQTRFTAVEETKVVKKDGTTDIATRKTNVDYTKNYVNSTIVHNKENGYVKKQNNTYYSHKGILKVETETGPYELLGISQMFDLKYTIANNEAKIFITDPNKSIKFLNMYENVNLDFNTSNTYNKTSFLEIKIKFDIEKIDEIEFNLNYIFGSYYSSCIRTLKFIDEDFETTDVDISSGDKYLVNTSDTLDTYMLEMIYQYGDSIYIKSGDFDMLIDAGQQPDGENVNDILTKYCTDNVLDMMIVTHGHGDHIGGFNGGALNSIENIKVLVDYGYIDNDYYYENIRTKYDGDYFTADECVNFKNGAFKKFVFSEKLSVEILNTGQYLQRGDYMPDGGNDNDYSVVCKLTFGNNTYLYSGDIAGNSFISNLKKEDIKDITVYKVAHHGATSYNTNNQDFLNYINPEIALVSAAIYDQYDISARTDGQWHPTKEFVNRILKTTKISKSKNLYYNGTMGTIHVVDDGINTPSVSGLGAKRGYYINSSLVTGEENKKFTETQFYKNR